MHCDCHTIVLDVKEQLNTVLSHPACKLDYRKYKTSTHPAICLYRELPKIIDRLDIEWGVVDNVVDTICTPAPSPALTLEYPRVLLGMLEVMDPMDDKPFMVVSEASLEQPIASILMKMANLFRRISLKKYSSEDVSPDLWALIDGDVENIISAVEIKLPGSLRDVPDMIAAIASRNADVIGVFKQLYNYLCHVLLKTGRDHAYGLLTSYEVSVLVLVKYQGVNVPCSIAVSEPVPYNTPHSLYKFYLYSLYKMSQEVVAGREPCVSIHRLVDHRSTDTRLLSEVVKMKRARGQLPTSRNEYWVESDPFNSGTYGIVHRCYIKKKSKYLLCVGKTPRPEMSLRNEKRTLSLLSNKHYHHIPSYVFLDDDWLMMEEVVLLPDEHNLRRSGRVLAAKLQKSMEELHDLGVAHNDLDHALNIGFVGGELKYIDFGCAKLRGDSGFEDACKRDDENIKRIIDEYVGDKV